MARVLIVFGVNEVSNEKKIKVTLVKSSSGRLKNHKLCVKGLGIRKMHNPVVILDTPENRGMINKASYMLRVEEV